MAIHDELKMKCPIKTPAHEALLNIMRTAAVLTHKGDAFFARFGLTMAQFNLMAVLNTYGVEGVSQADAGDMLVVTRANVTRLTDKLEKAELVIRESLPGDRRVNILKLTEKGRRLYEEVEDVYLQAVQDVMGLLSRKDIDVLISSLTQVRGGARGNLKKPVNQAEKRRKP